MTPKLPTPSQRSAQIQKELKREFNQCGKKKRPSKKKVDKPNAGVVTRAKFIELNKKWIEMEKAGTADKPL